MLFGTRPLSRSAYQAGALLVLLFTFWLALHYIDVKPIWGDERASILSVGGLEAQPRSPLEIWNEIQVNNPWHVPGFYFILSAWGPLVDWAIPALRVLPLLMGLLTLAWTYRLAADVADARVGLVAVVLLGTSAFLLHYFIQIRMYAFITALSAYTLWAYMRLVRAQRPSVWLWGGFLIGAVGLLYMHYFAAIVLGAIGLYHLLFARRSPRWLPVLGLFVVAGLVFLPWIGGLMAGLSRAAAFTALRERALDPLETVVRLTYFWGSGNTALAAVALVVAALPLVVKRRVPRWFGYVWFVTLAFFALVVVGNAFARVMHEDRLRYLIGIWPLLATIVAGGIVWLAHQRWTRVPALLLLAICASFGVAQTAQRWTNTELDNVTAFYPMQRVARALDGHVSPDDLVIHSITVDRPPDTDSPMHEYGKMRPFYFPQDAAEVMLQVAAVPAQQRAAQVEALSALDGHPRFWLAYQPDDAAPLLSEFQTALDERYDLCRSDTQEAGLQIDFYTDVPLCCDNYDRDDAAVASFGDGVRMTGLSLLPVEAGILPVMATWSVDDSVPAYTYSVGVYAFDAAGNLASQADYGLDLPVKSCQRAPLPVADLPPGTYELRIAIYNWETGERLTGHVTDSGAQGDLITVTTFDVE